MDGAALESREEFCLSTERRSNGVIAGNGYFVGW